MRHAEAREDRFGRAHRAGEFLFFLLRRREDVEFHRVELVEAQEAPPAAGLAPEGRPGAGQAHGQARGLQDFARVKVCQVRLGPRGEKKVGDRRGP
jgi:hypothetical protein